MLCVCVCVFLILSPAHHLIYVLFTLFISHTTVFTAFISCAYLQSLLPFCYKKKNNPFSSIKYELSVSPSHSYRHRSPFTCGFCMKSKHRSGSGLDSLSFLFSSSSASVLSQKKLIYSLTMHKYTTQPQLSQVAAKYKWK